MENKKEIPPHIIALECKIISGLEVMKQIGASFEELKYKGSHLVATTIMCQLSALITMLELAEASESNTKGGREAAEKFIKDVFEFCIAHPYQKVVETENWVHDIERKAKGN
jgi:hypothetical protein